MVAKSLASETNGLTIVLGALDGMIRASAIVEKKKRRQKKAKV